MSRVETIPRLFHPIKVGNMNLKHRVVLAPLTRYRNHDNHVPSDLAVEHYAQRASTPGTLLITEATIISAEAGGYRNVPGIWNDEQVAGWKKVVDAVHSKGSYIFCQLWALGRTAHHDVLESTGHSLVSASSIPLKSAPKPLPRPLTEPEIQSYVQKFAQAAFNAVHKAGFDGVEIHNANGYLLDQFLQSVSNERTDAYGGSIENRARFSLEVVSAVSKALGGNSDDKVAIRLSPWSNFQDMHMEDPMPQFSYLVKQLKEKHPDLVYIHVVEPRYNYGKTLDVVPEGQSNDFIREIWGEKPVISAGGYARENALEVAEKKGGLIAFGRSFLANPDLPLRLMHDVALTIGNRSKYYYATTTDPTGYTDYPFATELKVAV